MRIRRIAEFLGLRRSIVGVLAMCVLVGMGERMAERFLPIYLIALGGGVFAVSLLNGLDNLLSALYSFPGGWLSDRLGTKQALVVFNLLAMGGFLIVILIPTWPAVIVGSFFFLSWTAISLPATMDLIADVLPRTKRTMGVSMHSLVRRIPMALGPVVGGTLIYYYGKTDGVRLAFVVALAMAILALVFQQIMIRSDKPFKGKGRPPLHLTAAVKTLIGSELRNLLISDILIRFCEQIPYAFVVLWCMEIHGLSGIQFGVLTAVEMVTAMLIYVPVAYWADRGAKKPFIVITFINFTLFPFVLYVCRSFWPLVAAFVLRGLKEFGEPTRKALIMTLAPEDHKAVTFGVYYLIRDVIVSLAAFGAFLLWQISPAANFVTAGAFGIAGTVWFALRGREWTAMSRSEEEPSG